MSTGQGEPREEQPMSGTDLVEETGRSEPVAVGPGETASRDTDGAAGTDGTAGIPVAANAPAPAPAPAPDREDASLLALVDQLTVILERSDLGELEVMAGGTTVILRAPSSIERPATVVAPTTVAEQPAAHPAVDAAAPAAASLPAPVARPSVKAPLTGLFYGAPSPGATAYVSVGDHVSVGQIIGLIEAMKLFNEIKSDLAGRVVRVCAGNGALVKARQPLIEVELA
ncbi:MAG: hypothetical protein MUQ32_09180 [Chloroflexi bacterium]|nr:hypothetical protein [Chloroflexota bacterium]